ncbi:hypothetical protein HDV63DRAFT_128350 [Trichoderma sp. SZMC 28014]
MGIWRCCRSWLLHLLVLMMVPFDAVSELSGTYRTLLVLVILRWYSVFYTRVRDRGLCDTLYIPESSRSLHDDILKVRPELETRDQSHLSSAYRERLYTKYSI